MRNPSLVRFAATFGLTAVLLSSVACGHERPIKECAAKCDEAARACSERHDKDCGERAHKCARECER